MADEIDIAQLREQEERERLINCARRRIRTASRLMCEECGIPIPPARRLAVAGVTHCIDCQQILEWRLKQVRRD